MASKCNQLFAKAENKYIKTGGGLKRPMNAFLIFCKRQRGCVRRKYPLLENREVSRVLGEWWAALGNADKSLYSVLANQHKENLVRNYPDVKWFKPKMPGGKLKKVPDISQPGIVPGKLADESQLGGLSSLLHVEKEVVVVKEEKPPCPMPLKKRYRDEIYDFSVKEPIVEPAEEVKPEIKTENERPPSEANEDEGERLKVWRTHILEENNNVKQSRARACKGQRYREFMWTNYANSRRRANRWELVQDKNEVVPNKKPKTAQSDNNDKTPKISDSDDKADCSNLSSDADTNNSKDRKKKVTKKNKNAQIKSSSHIVNKNSDVNSKSKQSEDKVCDKSLPLRTESTSDTSDKGSSNKDGNKEGIVVGCRKRKIRRQGIRRLEPGMKQLSLALCS